MPFADGWPDAGDYPYRALIRIRYEHQIDVYVTQYIQGVTAAVLGEAAQKFIQGTSAAAIKARSAVRRPVKGGPAADAAEVDAQVVVTAGRLMADVDELCPRLRWPLPWPPPPWPWGDAALVHPVLEELTGLISDGDLRGVVTEQLDAAFGQVG